MRTKREKLPSLSYHFYKSYFKDLGLFGWLIMALSIAMLITGYVLSIGVEEVAFKFRLGFILILFATMFIELLLVGGALYEKRYRIKHNLTYEYSWQTIDMNKPYTIVFGDKGVGKTTYIEGVKLYDQKMQFVEIQDLNQLPSSIREYAENIICIMRVIS